MSKQQKRTPKDIEEAEWLVACDYAKEQGLGINKPTPKNRKYLRKMNVGVVKLLMGQLPHKVVFLTTPIGARTSRLSLRNWINSPAPVFEKDTIYCVLRFLGLAPSVYSNTPWITK